MFQNLWRKDHCKSLIGFVDAQDKHCCCCCNSTAAAVAAAGHAGWGPSNYSCKKKKKKHRLERAAFGVPQVRDEWGVRNTRRTLQQEGRQLAVAPEVVVDPSERKHTEHSLGATLETLLTDSPPLVASLATSTQRHNHRSKRG